MGRVIYAEENIFQYLQNISKKYSFSTGLILGQCSGQNDYVVLLSCTPEQQDKNESSIPQSLKDVQDSTIADHAKHVTRMLPGGMWVLGAFVCSSNDVFADSTSQSKLKSILYHIKKHLSNEPLLQANSPSAEKLLLHFNTADQKYICKSLDVNNMASAFKAADWKFQNNFTKWFQISSNFDLDQPSLGGNTRYSLQTQLKHFLSEVNKYIETAMITFDGEVREANDTLESLAGKRRKLKSQQQKIPEKDVEDKQSFAAAVFIPFGDKHSGEEDIVVKNCDMELHLMGILASQVFLNQKATIEEAVTAVKQDIVRSLAARLEMHWDSLVEEEGGSPEEKQTIHEPPRRVLVNLPNSSIAFSDYIFPGEGASEVLLSCKELLDIVVNESNVCKEFEVQGDPAEFYGKSSISIESSSSDDMMRPQLPTRLLIAAISVAAVLIAVAVALHFKRADDDSENTRSFH